ncbi:Hypothetical protein glysoja_026106 [Glycine soja]|uniref:Stress-response A/B barrel domain-containing protein n=1 Tax=Glycine soja TaxID=3848 RepID=A0A0B2RMW7_GLYSO|nr:hypothetical protein JHK87_018076 [Glycine soja]KHN34485.1 Hypothetical protein glysoja_026106 [Glycine soja]
MVLMISMMDLGAVMAGGLTEIGDGRNQPSTSEATNAYYVVGLMGKADFIASAPIGGFNAARKGRGKDIESHDMLRQGFTHVFLMAFNGKDEFNAFQTHPYDLEFTGVFSPAIKKIVVMDFPSNLVKALA